MLLLRDLLQQTLAEAQCARRWHGLFEAWQDTPDQTERARLLQQLAALRIDDPRSDVLRLTFLSRATRDARFVHDAAMQTLAVQPPNPDRLAAFAAAQCMLALEMQPTRADFAVALSGARLPEIAWRLAYEAAALLPAALAPRIPRAIERVAVVASYVGNRFHTPSVLAVNQCELLVRARRRAHVFSCQELLPPEMSLFHGDGGMALLPQPDAAHWSGALPAGVGMNVSDGRFSMRSRWRGMLAAIAEFDPDVVLFVGLYSALASALYTVRPVIGLSTNTVPPLAPLDVWLAAEEAGAGRPRAVWDGKFPPPWAHFHPYRIKAAEGPWQLTRAQLRLPEDAVIWVTAGFRLEQEVADPWAARMIAALAAHPGALWLLGGGDGQVPKSLQQAPPGRVCALATRPDMAAVLSLCDIYVNPPRMGGGFSVAEAMAGRLPVLAFAGSDGGDKVGTWALCDIDAYMDRLLALSASSALRYDMGQAMRARFAERFDLDASGPSLIGAGERAGSRAGSRLKPMVS